MNFLINLLILFFLLITDLQSTAFAAETNYKITAQKNLPNQLGEFRHIELTLDRTIDIYAATLNDNYQAEIFRQSESNQFFAKYLEDLSKDHNFIVGINGGYYSTDFKPVGLFIEEGKTLQSANRGRLLSTCVGTDDDKKIFLGLHRTSCANAYSAMQTGPTLLEHGNVTIDMKSVQKRTPKTQAFYDQHRRTILAKTSDGKLLVIVTAPVTLLEMANFLENNPQAFGVKKIATALNLDGGSSTGMYIRFQDEPFYFHELKPVKTFVFFK